MPESFPISGKDEEVMKKINLVLSRLKLKGGRLLRGGEIGLRIDLLRTVTYCSLQSNS